MKAEEAIKVLDKLIRGSVATLHSRSGIEALEMAIKALEQQKWNVVGYDPETGWLTNIPEDGQRVILSNRGYVREDEFVNEGTDGCWFDGIGEIEEGMAWMPLPEPYKENELCSM